MTGTDEGRANFVAALRAHDSAAARKAIAARTGVTEARVSQWIGGAGPPNPDQVFAIERALGLPPGHLSHHLGYVPVGTTSVAASIASDPALSPSARRALETLYLSLSSEVDS